MSTAPTILKPLRSATWRTMPSPIGPRPKCNTRMGPEVEAIRILLKSSRHERSAIISGPEDGPWPWCNIGRVLTRWLAIVSIAAVIAFEGAGLLAQPPSQEPAVLPVEITPAPALPPEVQQGRSPRNANYDISVRLDPANRSLKGEQVLTWRNVTDQPASSLRFHLY